MGRTFEALRNTRDSRSTFQIVSEIDDDLVDHNSDTVEDLTVTKSLVELVPFSEEDLPTDNNEVPFVEIGAGTATPTVPTILKLLPPNVEPATHRAIQFHLLPELSSLPITAHPLGEDLVTYHQPEHYISQQYAQLVGGIGAQLRSSSPAVLMLAPVASSAQVTTTCLNLAITRAAEGVGRVLIVELHRDEHSCATRMGVPHVPGLRELLGKTAPLAMGFHRTSVDSLYLLPAGDGPLGQDELAQVPQLLSQLRSRFDWVVVAAPGYNQLPLDVWFRHADKSYLLMDQDEWDSPVLDSLYHQIGSASGKLGGCITIQQHPTHARK
ncbi:MAG: hypothetical protein R3B84_01800 [Zavarzinella sp.]